MGLLKSCILGGIHILLIGVDVVFFMLLAKMLSYRWRPRWLTAVNATGEPVVRWFTGCIAYQLRRLHIEVSSQRALLFIGMLALSTIRMLLTVIFNWSV